MYISQEIYDKCCAGCENLEKGKIGNFPYIVCLGGVNNPEICVLRKNKGGTKMQKRRNVTQKQRDLFKVQLLKAMQRKKMLNVDVANASKGCFTDKAVSLWKCGKGLPSKTNLKILAEIFNVSEGYFFEENKVPKTIKPYVRKKKSFFKKLLDLFK